ncbi:uncharacterized protein LOC126558971 [Anopheles maculipalpis]|uniref:uncharacterized protein LOC126558971 n=1 Tax=Anopheles maculipalpis TaxID=1496333 RepID=UPI002159314F|nr:uncharacterized protein LOC126558971 [Anopheles maculipalpis]
MRSATKSKMTKIQNYVREHGEDCPYKLNLVERLIWDTFSVKPEEYMKDLNLKLWREKQQPRTDGTVGGPQHQSAVDSVSSCSSQMSAEQNFDMGWNQVATTTTGHDTGLGWNSPMPSSFASMSRDNSMVEDSNQTVGGFYSTSSCTLHSDQNYGAQSSTAMAMGYQGYAGGSSNQWTSSCSELRDEASLHHPPKIASSTDLVPGSKMLRELNKLFDLVLKQNEEILALLRQPNSEH